MKGKHVQRAARGRHRRPYLDHFRDSGNSRQVYSQIPSVTVLIPAHNEAETIQRCLEAVKDQTYPIERVIVVADACSDDTAAISLRLGVEVYEADVRDKAAAQNTALWDITSEIVVGYDADTFPTPTCTSDMVAAMVERHLDAAGATILPAQPRGFFIRNRRYAYALGRRWWRAAQSAVGRVQVLTGACYAFRTKAIQGIGGFPSVGISSDMDATWALHRAGYRAEYVGEALAYTIDPATFAQYHSQMRRWAAGYFQTMAKHRRGLWNPKAMLVVWTALIDLILLPLWYGIAIYGLIHQLPYIRWYWAYVLGHAVITTILVATVVGWRESLLGVGPYHLVNFYNKGLYMWTMIREWVLGRHFAAWTGRTGRAVVITPMSRSRRATLASVATVVLLAVI